MMTTDLPALAELLKNDICKHGGMISFDHFMETVLYHPDYGYYLANHAILGKNGDFTTASELSPLYAACFANTCQAFLDAEPNSDIVEYGAGSGRFACELLTALGKHGTLPNHYYFYDISPHLRAQQQLLLQQHCPDYVNRCVWLTSPPQNIQGILILNEVVDALPIHRFRIEETGIVERCVSWQHERFTWASRPPQTSLFQQTVEQLCHQYHLMPGYESEVNLRLPGFIDQLHSALNRGIILIADYGYGQREYYHPERSHGTLTCFYQHHRHDNPLINLGHQDITAHVDFTRTVELAVQVGFSLLGYTTQAAFLLDNGLLSLTEASEHNTTETDRFRLHQAVKTLTLPTEMGERIKIMALAKSFTLRLPGFHLQDRRRELS